MDSQDLRNELANFYGSEKIYRHSLNRHVLYTEGVQFFAEKAGCYWFLDILATEPAIQQCMRDNGAIIWFKVKGGKAMIYCRTDSGEPSCFTRKIDLTDAPEGEWKFYFFNSVIMLPSEY